MYLYVLKVIQTSQMLGNLVDTRNSDHHTENKVSLFVLLIVLLVLIQEPRGIEKCRPLTI